MNGISAVAVSGSASVIHQAAISTTSPATMNASRCMPAGVGRKMLASSAAAPTSNPICLAAMCCDPPLARTANSGARTGQRARRKDARYEKGGPEAPPFRNAVWRAPYLGASTMII